MNMNRYIKVLLGVAMISLGGACARDSGGGSPAAVPPPTGTPGPSGTPPICPAGQIASVNNTCVPAAPAAGSGVPLVLVSAGQLGRMFFKPNPNNPQNVTIQVNTASNKDAVVIRFTDNGVNRQASFGTAHPYSGVSDRSLNKWYDDQTLGKRVWKGFFQDAFGAVVLVFDKTTATGDGTPGNVVGGSIWFQNFNRYYPNNPVQGREKMCWQISAGPYDCRSWLFMAGESENWPIMPSLVLYPNNKGPDQNMLYEKLGDFGGIDRSQAGF